MKLTTNYSLTNHVYIKTGSALNNPQGLIYHKTPTSQPINTHIYMYTCTLDSAERWSLWQAS